MDLYNYAVQTSEITGTEPQFREVVQNFTSNVTQIGTDLDKSTSPESLSLRIFQMSTVESNLLYLIFYFRFLSVYNLLSSTKTNLHDFFHTIRNKNVSPRINLNEAYALSINIFIENLEK
jgi:hypothetical protein